MDLLICARLGSSRLPGKALLEIGNNLNSLDIIIEKVILGANPNRIILATTSLPKDNLLESWAKDKGIDVFRGSEKDVLGRIHEAVQKFDCQDVIEILGDNPLIPIELISKSLDSYNRMESGMNYLASATSEYKFSNEKYIYPIGIRIQIFNRIFIDSLVKKAKSPQEREHATSYIYDKPDFCNIKLETPNIIYPDYVRRFNFAINTEKQYFNAKEIYMKYGINCRISELICWLDDKKKEDSFFSSN